MIGLDPRALELAGGAMVALALAGLAVLAWRRHRRRGSELAAALCAIAGLYGLFARPVLWRDVPPGTALLLTGGEPAFRPSEEQIALETFALPPASSSATGASEASGATRAGARATEIPDVTWLRRHRSDIEELRVSGHGLLAAEWEGAPWRLEVLPEPPVGRGFRELRWQRELTLGSDLVVRGVWSQCPACAGVRLAGAAGIEESTLIDSGVSDVAVSSESTPSRRGAVSGDGSFSLRGRPRAAGRFLVSLTAVDAAGGALFSQDLDVVVTPAWLPAVLWLERAPSFESRSVRRLWERLGGTMLVRAAWSRERLRATLVGESPQAAAQITSRSVPIADFEVVVADPESLRRLTAAETASLRHAVEELGTGLLLRLPREEAVPAERLLGGFAIRAVPGVDELLARPAWPGFEAAEPLAVGPRELVAEFAQRALVSDRAGRVLAASRFAGAGAVAVSLVEGSYRWSLGGQAGDHAELWSRVLGAVAPQSAAGWSLPAAPALVDIPFDAVWTGTMAPTVSCTEPDGERIAVPAVATGDAVRWRARLWPRLVGWHECEASVAQPANGNASAPPAGGGPERTTTFYGHPPSAWQPWLEARRHDATAVAAARSRPAIPAAAATVRQPVETPRWPWYLLFLAGAAYLWAAQRWIGPRAGSA